MELPSLAAIWAVVGPLIGYLVRPFVDHAFKRLFFRPKAEVEISRALWQRQIGIQVNDEDRWHVFLDVAIRISYSGDATAFRDPTVSMRCEDGLSTKLQWNNETRTMRAEVQALPKRIDGNGRWEGDLFFDSGLLNRKPEKPKFTLEIATVSGARKQVRIKAEMGVTWDRIPRFTLT